MRKTKAVMVYFLSLSLVFAFMVTTVPTLATAETLAPFEPEVSLGKPLPDATLKECTAMGDTTITVVMINKSSGSGNQQSNTVIIPNSTPPVNKTITGTGKFKTTVTVPYWFHK